MQCTQAHKLWLLILCFGSSVSFSTGTLIKGELLDEVFTHELCSYPPALFKTSNVLLSPNKAALADAMWKQVPAMPSPATPAQYVLDGGTLLHRILSPSGEKFYAIRSPYVQYVSDKYRSPVIVFDGYQNGPSTEDNTHSRRTKSSMAAEVRFTGDLICTMKKGVFLSNKTNKQRFITLLSSHLQQSNIIVVNAEADADVLVVQTAIESAASNDTVLVGDGTDLLILLCCNSKSTNCELYFRPEPKSNSQRTVRCWNINQVQRVLDHQICDNILFAHILLGCDTTSRVFGIGKPDALKKLRSNAFFRKKADVFQDPHAAPEDIRIAWENALVCL